MGLRELRADLSSYVDAVKQGRSYVVTERGQAVAQLVPVPGSSAYERLVLDGLVRPATRRPSPLPEPVAGHGIVTDLIAGQRR